MEVEQQAREMGWKPKEQFKGPEEKWVDAAEYVRRGEEVLPIVRNENRRLQETVGSLNGEIAKLQAALRDSQSSMTEFRQFQAEMLQEKLKEQRVKILADLREARNEGNDDTVIELEEQLDANREAAKTAKTAPAAAPAPAPAAPPPLTAEQEKPYKDWVAANPWAEGSSEEDLAKQGAAERFGRIAAQNKLLGKAFFDFIDEKMEKAFPTERRPGKLEDGRPGGGGGGTGGKAGFNSLPADAKAYAESKINQFVGPNKMFKTADEWKAHYAKVYNAQEQEA